MNTDTITATTQFTRPTETANRPRRALLTPQEVAHYCRVDLMTVYRWLTKGRLRGVKAGSKWRVRRRDLWEFMRDGAVQAVAQAVPPEANLAGACTPTKEELRRRVEATMQQRKVLGL